MDHEFWHQRWSENRIGFHSAAPNPLLTGYWDRLELEAGQRVFVPLCGKTLDIDWLLAAGFQVVGSELSEVAVAAVFDRLGLVPDVARDGAISVYRAQNLVLFAGDFFAVSEQQLGAVDAVFDRAALVALPAEMRDRYSGHLVDITGAVKQLLICFTYDQARMDGPPFSVDAHEVARLYSAEFQIDLLRRIPNTGNLAQRAGGTEEAWLLTPQNS